MFDNNSKINNLSLIIIASVCIVVSLIYTKTVLVPLVVSLFIYVMISSGVDKLREVFNISYKLSLALNIVFSFIFIALIIYFLIFSIGQLVQSIDLYSKRVEEIFKDLIIFLKDNKLSFGIDNIKSKISDLPFFSFLKNIGKSLFSIVGNIGLVIIFVIFLLLGGTSTKNKLATQLKKKVSIYLSVKLMVSILTAICTWIILTLFNVEFALMFSLLTFILNFIPSLGSIIAVILPLPVLFLQFGFNSTFFLVFALSSVVQLTIGNFLEPKFLENSMNLHPIVTLMSLIFWSLVWGVIGAFLAVPLTAVIRIILARIPATKNAANLMSGHLPS